MDACEWERAPVGRELLVSEPGHGNEVKERPGRGQSDTDSDTNTADPTRTWQPLEARPTHQHPTPSTTCGLASRSCSFVRLRGEPNDTFAAFSASPATARRSVDVDRRVRIAKAIYLVMWSDHATQLTLLLRSKTSLLRRPERTQHANL